MPAATQVVVQPVGTQLQVNNLNGDEYASQYVTGLGGNGIANAVTSPDCASGCEVKVEPTYPVGENYASSTWNSGAGGTHVEDDRNGQRRDTYFNPTTSLPGGVDAGQVIDVTSTRSSQAEVAAGGSSDPNSYALSIVHRGLTGGSNLFPEAIGSVPYFKSNYNAMNVVGQYNTMGQHVLDSQSISCYGVGDCLMGGQFLTSSGGFRDEADEGAHPFDIQIQEDFFVFQGVCSAGCSPGSTVVTVGSILAGGTQGEGRYLIDKNPAKTITNGVLTGGTGQVNSGPGASATFSGTNFPVSVFLATAQVIPSQANNTAPGAVKVAIAATGVTAGFATSTAAIPSPSGVACLMDPPINTSTTNYEMANYSVVDGTHLQMTLNKPHHAGTTIAFGGLCGYGLEQTVDTAGVIRQVFPVLGSYSTTGLYYAGGLTAIVGVQNNTSAFLNVSVAIAAIARSNGVVTVTTAGSLPVDVNGLSMTISGVTDQSYNGNFVVTTTGSNTLTFSEAGANSTSTGGTVSKLTGGYVLYPMAEVLGVFDTATKSVDGQLTLAPNTVAWAVNDSVEEPHYYQQRVAQDVAFIGQSMPRPTLAQTAGVEYEENVGPGLTGWTVTNSVSASNYLGNGGTHTAPRYAYQALGIWSGTMDMQAGERSVFSVHCNSHGCGNWNSGYDLFELDSSAGSDSISYQPTTSALQMVFRGKSYQFTPQGFTAGTINAGTVNATTLNGTVGAAQLPLFGASGTTHSPGAVPDPGATAGTARYLREDGTWSVPSGSTGSGQSGGSGLPSGAAPIAGAAADYDFLQGSGSVLTDISGNGNNGALGSGAAAPQWIPNGLSFTALTQSVSLPASLNGSQGWIFSVYINPLTQVALPANQYPMLLASTLGPFGLNLLYQDLGLQGSAFSPSSYSGGKVQSACSTLVAGFHVFGYILGVSGTSTDHFYIDGNECTRGGGTSGGSQTSGNLVLGSSPSGSFNGSGFYGTMYRALAFPALNAAQMKLYSQQLTSDAASRGVPLVPALAPQPAPSLFAIGDSITFGVGVTTPWPSLLNLTNQQPYVINNYGIPGAKIAEISGSEASRVGPQCGGSGPMVATVFAGINDLASFETPLQTMGFMSSEIATLKAAGCRVFVATMLSSAANAGSGGPWMRQRIPTTP